MKKELNLIDNIEYYMAHSEDEEYSLNLFTVEERNFSYTICDFERNRYRVDLLLREGKIESWMEILVWYQYLDGKG